MKWHAWIATAAIAAAVGMVASGLLASLLVDWYRISSFEGGSGFFVVGLALGGLIGGFIIGLIASAIVAARPAPRLLTAVGGATGAVMAIVLVIGAGARLLADIPPEIDGDTLLLHVELRWPPSGEPDPATLSDAVLTLGATSGSVMRRSEQGPMWVEDARQEDGRWIVPGAARLFTRRGGRVIVITAGETTLGAFEVPLPASPGSPHESWSDWLPRTPGAADGAFSYRFRVVRASRPVRVQRAGKFEVEVLASDFRTSPSGRMSAISELRILYDGQPVDALAAATDVAEVRGPTPALFVRTPRDDYGQGCAFVLDEGTRARVIDLGPCASSASIRPVTSDVERFRAAAARENANGWLDRETFDTPGLYLLGSTLIDTRNRTAHAITFPPQPYVAFDLPPLTVSPDERKVVLYATGARNEPVLFAIDPRSGSSDIAPIDPMRMRFSTRSVLDPAWVAHYFEWVPQDDGYRLRERASFEPLPYKGVLSPDFAVPYYTLAPGSVRLRDAVVRILEDAGAERLPGEEDDAVRRVRFEGATLEVRVMTGMSSVGLGRQSLPVRATSCAEPPRGSTRRSRLADGTRHSTGERLRPPHRVRLR